MDEGQSPQENADATRARLADAAIEMFGKQTGVLTPRLGPSPSAASRPPRRAR